MTTARKILAGSYTDSVYTLEFDPGAPTGTRGSGRRAAPTLELVSQVDVGHRPSWIGAHPSDGSLVFAGLEQADGQIVVVKYGESGEGQKIVEATCPSGGADPCTLLVTEDELVVGNYSGGTLATIPISTSPPYTRPAGLRTLALPFDEAGELAGRRDPARQEAAHPHQAVFNTVRNATGERELLVPDLGSDKVWQLVKRGTDGRWTVRGFVGVEVGGGPRHVAIYGDALYVLLELTSELAVYKLHSGARKPTHLVTLSTLKESPAPSIMKAAEILIPTPNRLFTTAYIYVSNRDDPHPEGDTIAILSLERGEEHPELVNEVRTGLGHVRGMVFGGENDEWLVVGGVGNENKSVRGGIKVYERVEGGRGLRQVAELDSAVGSRLKATSFLWL